ARRMGWVRQRALGRVRDRSRRCRCDLAAAGWRPRAGSGAATLGATATADHSVKPFMTAPSNRRVTVSRLFVDGAWVEGAAGSRPVVDKYNGETIGQVEQASRAQVAAAVAA